MNILVLKNDGQLCMRPDTSLNKENGDFYAPDGLCRLDWSPVLFARICKAGKAVQKGFADRYYDSLAFGIFLYPDASCLYDGSTILPYPLMGKEIADGADFRILKDRREIYSNASEDLRERLEDAIVRCSQHSSIRIGDFVALEIAAAECLMTDKDTEQCSLEAQCCGTKTIEININF